MDDEAIAHDPSGDNHEDIVCMLTEALSILDSRALTLPASYVQHAIDLLDRRSSKAFA